MADATCSGSRPPGSVDDGKSTLIGRLLYDSKSLFSDQLEAVEQVSRDRGNDYTDLALLTDGLRAEREQGITIDVAYRYFATPRRKFIIADTPGHIQYTRNMVTGRLDGRRRADPARRPQGHHRAEPAARVPRDAAGRAAPRRVRQQDGPGRLRRGACSRRSGDEFSEFATRLRVRDMTFIPISALHGRQRRHPLRAHAVVRGVDAAHHLERLHVASRPQLRRRPVPGPVRGPAAEQRGPRLPRLRRDGRVGRAQAGRPRAWRCPAASSPTIASIDTADGPVDEAYPPMAVTIPLTDEHRHLAAATCSAGRTTCRRSPRTSTRRSAGWTRPRRSPSGASTRSSTRPAGPARWSRSSTTGSTSTRSTATRTATELSLNEIGRIQLRVTQPLFVDPYQQNRADGRVHPRRRGDRTRPSPRA